MGVNCDATGQPLLTASRNDAFAFGLSYETAGRYDGSIGQQRWLTSRQPTQYRQFVYNYDASQRLTGAAYTGATGEDFSLASVAYDKNGNITALTRTNVDQLTYSYGALSNQLLAVTDVNSSTLGFVDNNTSGNDYSYNADGSLNKDLNRKITAIAYNVLKLPKQVSFSSGTTVSYQYDATGKKLKMSLSGGDSRDYVGPVEYLNSSLFAIKHPEGRLAQGNSYEYFLTDHLGNIRAVVANSGVTQWTEYDPWGMELAALSSGSSTNRDKFNGKENLAEIGNGMLDFGARLYDATIGRWGLIDPLAEKATHWSPYRFGFDNPVSVTDPTGMFEYSNGYTTQDSKDITGAMEFNGVFQNGGGDGPGPGKGQASTRQEKQAQTSGGLTTSNTPGTGMRKNASGQLESYKVEGPNGVFVDPFLVTIDVVYGSNFSGVNTDPDQHVIGGSPIGLSLGGSSTLGTKLLPNAFSRFWRFEYHFRKHAGEWGAISKEAFYKRALSLLDGPTGGNIQGFTNTAGYTFRINMRTGEFGVMRPNSVVETFYRRLNEPAKYWAEQVAKWNK
ncbi:RHS repeat-associated core domain-containing protein [Spirosoma sp. SC4-14]|uniref:RHS repeat-associated core domain-containing protein n=1 Tax=Spirosoma sp. SC4-14 TaxID=3128900 RepID=UPI0030D30944